MREGGPLRPGRGIRVRVIDALSGALGDDVLGVQKREQASGGVTESATHSTRRNAAGHHHAGSHVRLPGGQRTHVVSHGPDYVGMRRGASNVTLGTPRLFRSVTRSEWPPRTACVGARLADSTA